MSKAPPRRPTSSNEDHPEDIFDQPLETLPLKRASSDDVDSADEQAKVGYCSPPQHTRWKKGGASPNPLGRPRKQRSDKLALLMGESIRHPTSQETITKREALDRIVLQNAISKGGPWIKLWEERKERDAGLRQHEADIRSRSAASKREDKIASELRREMHYRIVLLSFIKTNFPGVVETQRRLIDAGLIESSHKGLCLTKRGRKFAAEEPASDSTE